MSERSRFELHLSDPDGDGFSTVNTSQRRRRLLRQIHWFLRRSRVFGLNVSSISHLDTPRHGYVSIIDDVLSPSGQIVDLQILCHSFPHITLFSQLF